MSAPAMATHKPLKRLVRSLWCACLRWAKCDCVDLSAAFAYYTLQSIFPILLISLSIASWFLGRQEALESKIIAYASGVLPPSAVVIVQNTLMQLVRQGFGAGLLGAGVLLLTAGNVYLTLQRGSERLWNGVIAPQQRNLPFKLQAVQFIRIRLEAFFVVILIGLLVVLDQLSANVRMIPTAALSELSLTIPWLGNLLSHVPVLQFGRLIRKAGAESHQSTLHTNSALIIAVFLHSGTDGFVRMIGTRGRGLGKLNTPTLAKINHNTHHPNPQGKNQDTANHSIGLKSRPQREDASTNRKIKNSKSKANQ